VGVLETLGSEETVTETFQCDVEEEVTGVSLKTVVLVLVVVEEGV
jgi:hypothetical protein